MQNYISVTSDGFPLTEEEIKHRSRTHREISLTGGAGAGAGAAGAAATAIAGVGNTHETDHDLTASNTSTRTSATEPSLTSVSMTNNPTSSGGGGAGAANPSSSISAIRNDNPHSSVGAVALATSTSPSSSSSPTSKMNKSKRKRSKEGGAHGNNNNNNNNATTTTTTTTAGGSNNYNGRRSSSQRHHSRRRNAVRHDDETSTLDEGGSKGESLSSAISQATAKAGNVTPRHTRGEHRAQNRQYDGDLLEEELHPSSGERTEVVTGQSSQPYPIQVMEQINEIEGNNTAAADVGGGGSGAGAPLSEAGHGSRHSSSADKAAKSRRGGAGGGKRSSRRKKPPSPPATNHGSISSISHQSGHLNSSLNSSLNLSHSHSSIPVMGMIMDSPKPVAASLTAMIRSGSLRGGLGGLPENPPMVSLNPSTLYSPHLVMSPEQLVRMEQESLNIHDSAAPHDAMQWTASSSGSLGSSEATSSTCSSSSSPINPNAPSRLVEVKTGGGPVHPIPGRGEGGGFVTGPDSAAGVPVTVTKGTGGGGGGGGGGIEKSMSSRLLESMLGSLDQDRMLGPPSSPTESDALLLEPIPGEEGYMPTTPPEEQSYPKSAAKTPSPPRQSKSSSPSSGSPSYQCSNDPRDPYYDLYSQDQRIRAGQDVTYYGNAVTDVTEQSSASSVSTSSVETPALIAEDHHNGYQHHQALTVEYGTQHSEGSYGRREESNYTIHLMPGHHLTQEVDYIAGDASARSFTTDPLSSSASSSTGLSARSPGENHHHPQLHDFLVPLNDTSSRSEKRMLQGSEGSYDDEQEHLIPVQGTEGHVVVGSNGRRYSGSHGASGPKGPLPSAPPLWDGSNRERHRRGSTTSSPVPLSVDGSPTPPSSTSSSQRSSSTATTNNLSNTPRKAAMDTSKKKLHLGSTREERAHSSKMGSSKRKSRRRNNSSHPVTILPGAYSVMPGNEESDLSPQTPLHYDPVGTPKTAPLSNGTLGDSQKSDYSDRKSRYSVGVGGPPGKSPDSAQRKVLMTPVARGSVTRGARQEGGFSNVVTGSMEHPEEHVNQSMEWDLEMSGGGKSEEAVASPSLRNSRRNLYRQDPDEKDSWKKPCANAGGTHMVMGFLVFVVIALAATMVTLLVGGNGGTDVPTAGKPTSAPSMVQEERPQPPTNTLTGFDIEKLILENTPTKEISLRQETSPQAQAYKFANGRFNSVYWHDPERTLQRYALVTLFFSLNGFSWSDNAGWLTIVDECTWFSSFEGGQSPCDSNHQLTSLVLRDNGLIGHIPPEIVLLTSLESIDLSGNRLYDWFLPKGLPNLKSLVVQRNDEGTFLQTKLGFLTSLEVLSLNSNRLAGSIPSELGLLTNLTILSLSNNNLKSTIPTELGAMTALKMLDLQENDLTSTLPTEIGSFLLLTDLLVGYNSLTGAIPTHISSLSTLETLLLGSNKFNESLPTEIGFLTHLKSLWVGSNQIPGTVPSEIGRLGNLIWLDMSSNSFNGTLDFISSELKELQRLDLGYNFFEGNIPSSLRANSKLSMINFHNNRLTGEIPSELGSLHLALLDVSGNNLTSFVPTEVLESTLIDAFVNVTNTNISGPISCTEGLDRKNVRIEVDCESLTCEEGEYQCCECSDYMNNSSS